MSDHFQRIQVHVEFAFLKSRGLLGSNFIIAAFFLASMQSFLDVHDAGTGNRI